MIYIIDDKKDRQVSFGWGITKFNEYRDIIKGLYSLDDIKMIGSDKILNKKNIVIYHESFFENPKNRFGKGILDIKNEMIKYSEENKVPVIFFSGSIGGRFIENNRVTIPVAVLYKNLEYFVLDFKNNGPDVNLMKIIYGNDTIKEQILEKKQQLWNLLYEQDNDSVIQLNRSIQDTIQALFFIKKININYSNITVGMLKLIINNI